MAVAYLLYAAYARRRAHPVPPGIAIIALVLGSVFPDIVDKPLAWRAGLIPSGRSLTHSFLVLGPFCLLVALLGRRYDRETIAHAVAIGVLSHPTVDAVPAAWGNADPRFLVWPVMGMAPDECGPPTVISLLRRSLPRSYFHLEFVLFAIATIVWRAHGYPGIDSIGWPADTTAGTSR